MPEKSARLVAYGVAVLATAVSLLVRWPLWPVLGDAVPHMTFFPAVMIAAYFGGFRPGLLATILSAVAANYFFTQQLSSFHVTSGKDMAALILFVLVGTIISGLSESLHRARLRIAVSERRYAVTLSSIGDAVIATDTQARVTFMNPVAEALTGWPQQDATGRPLGEVFHIINEQTREPVEDPAAKVLRLGSVVGLANHTVLLTRDGREVPVDDCGAPISGGGGITGVVLVFRDTTQRRRAEEAESLRRAYAPLKLAVRGSNINIWEIDMPDGVVENGRLTLATFWEQLGYERPDSPTDFATGAALVHPDDRPHLEAAMRSYLAGETGEFEVENRSRRKDGAYRWFLTRGVAVRDAGGKPIRFLGSGVDITDRKRAEEALRGSEQRFRTFVDHATDAFFLHDEQGRILDVNRQACESLGYTRDELVGMVAFDFDPDVTPADIANFGRTLIVGAPGTRPSTGEVPSAPGIVGAPGTRPSTGEVPSAPGIVGAPGTRPSTGEVPSAPGIVGAPGTRPSTGEVPSAPGDGGGTIAFESRHRRKDGTVFPVEVRGQGFWEGGRRFIVSLARDITDRKRAEEALRESERRWRGLTEALPQLVWSAAPDGACDYFSRQWTEHTGVSENGLLGWRWLEVLHPDDRERTRRFWLDSVAGRGPYDVEYRVRRSDGVYRWFKTRGTPIRDEAGDVCKWFGSCTDITDLRQTEEALRAAKESAESANRAKDEFLANVSHEIRTPMNAILGMTELALDTPLTDDQRQCLKTVKSAADNLLGIINDLLDFSKIEAGKLELTSADFSLRTAVGDTLRALAVRAHSKGLELIYHVQPDLPDCLLGDAGRLRQVLVNLVGNALKFTDEGEVVVQVVLASRERQRPEDTAAYATPPVADAPGSPGVDLRFAVRDTGIGIPQDKQESIFRAFEQEDTSTTRKYGGTGLGLTIAARLVDLMGGQISVDSEPGRGSTFAFTARFGLQPHPAAQAAAQSPVLLHNLPVLVVDDNATNRRILEEWLRGWQMKPFAVGDGVAAMDALWHGTACGRPYALVLLDARMPDTDGLALAAQIRKRAELSATRIILLTSGASTRRVAGDQARPRELRIDARLLKPVQQEQLLETIYQVMSRGKGDEARVARELTAAPAAAATALHILVAEDTDFSARLMEQLLARGGHRVRLATNGPEALALAEEGVFDLLLLDIHMPELDGFQVVQAVRERERTAGGHLPVIALTARSRKEDRQRCLAAGMDDFLTKPVSTAALFAAIDRLVRVPGGSHGASRRFLADGGERGSLLDPGAVLTACGDDAEGLRSMCQDFQTYAPARLAEVGDALRERDAPRLRRAAHKFCALLFAFSTVAGNVASDLEDHAAGGQLEEAQPLVEQLETMTRELMRLAAGLSLETLRQQAEVTGERQPTG